MIVHINPITKILVYIWQTGRPESAVFVDGVYCYRYNAINNQKQCPGRVRGLDAGRDGRSAAESPLSETRGMSLGQFAEEIRINRRVDRPGNCPLQRYPDHRIGS